MSKTQVVTEPNVITSEIKDEVLTGVTPTEIPVEGQLSAEEKEAIEEEAFSAGFKDDSPADITIPVEPVKDGDINDASINEDAPAQAASDQNSDLAPETVPAKDEDPLAQALKTFGDSLNEQLDGKFRKLDSKYGELNSKLIELGQKPEEPAKPAEPEVPISDKVTEAIQNSEGFKTLNEEYSTIGEGVQDGITVAVNTAVAEMTKQMNTSGETLSPEQIEAQVTKLATEKFADMVTEQLISQKHSEWRTEVRDPKFAEWVDDQPAKVRKLYDSDQAADIITLLDSYKGITAADPNKDPANKQEQTKRLANAVSPKGGGGVPIKPKTHQTEEEAFSQGFKTG